MVIKMEILHFALDSGNYRSSEFTVKDKITELKVSFQFSVFSKVVLKLQNLKQTTSPIQVCSKCRQSKLTLV